MIKLSALADSLWGSCARLRWLLFTSLVLFCAFLGTKEIWTQEHRWADIVSGMFYRDDFFHPYIGEVRYYDKPLLSYWFMALISWLSGSVNAWALRLPSALSGVLAVWSIYQIGKNERDKSFGLLCGWMLATTFFIAFWARVSSADMLNVGGTLLAVAWYVAHKKHTSFLNYAVFFVILAVTSLCKGLGGAIVPLIVVFADMCLNRSFKQHLTLTLALAALPALIIYMLPFWLSSYFGGEAYGQSGLYLVYKENILRYFQPFDHQGPIYTYFIYLPLYLLPWTLFFIPALLTLPQRWRQLSMDAKWNVLSLALIFLFFTISGSRRSYYVLPVVPFAVLVTADWLRELAITSLRQRLAALCAVVSALLILVVMDAAPAWYYSRCGVERFATHLKHEAEKQRPWSAWHVVMLDAETKLSFYLNLPPNVQNYDVVGDRNHQSAETLTSRWPILKKPDSNTIIISRQLYAPILDKVFPYYIKVTMPKQNCLPFGKNSVSDMPVAYIPAG